MSLEATLSGLIENHSHRIPLIEAIVSGELPREQLKALARQLYAEARAALQVKIPERLRLCPIDLPNVRSMWCQILAEESGDFEQGRDHASLFMPTCVALGIPEAELNQEYGSYLKIVKSLLLEEPSIEVTMRELTRMYVEESVLAKEANRIGDALREHYEVPESHLKYFRLHAIVDQEHSALALREVVRTAEEYSLQDSAVSLAEECLKFFPIWYAEHRERLAATTT